MTPNNSYTKIFSAIVVAWSLHGTVQAQLVINEDLRGKQSTYKWVPINGACLTAGTDEFDPNFDPSLGISTPIPRCITLPYYEGKVLVGGTNGRLADKPGEGALRLTNGDVKTGGDNGDGQTGAVVSEFKLPTNQGLQVMFETRTYGGDGYYLHGFPPTGADGIAFFLADGNMPVTVGAIGGSLGYSCSNINNLASGVRGGYFGIGIDEFGNFSNSIDNTTTGPGFKGGRISARGAGDTHIDSLMEKWSSFYPENYFLARDLPSDTPNPIRNRVKGERTAEAVKRTCKTGLVHNYSGETIRDPNTGAPVLHREPTSIKLPYNYAFLAYSDLPDNAPISNQQGVVNPLRGEATSLTYLLRITEAGLLDFYYSVNGGSPIGVITDYRVTANNGPLPESLRFGFAAGTAGGNNVHEILCFKATPLNESSGSAAANAKPLSEVSDSQQLYSANYSVLGWWGQLTARELLYSSESDQVTIAQYANWEANCGLTGTPDCTAVGPANSPIRTTTPVSTQQPSERTLLTWNNVGVPLRWSNLSENQKTALSVGDIDPTRGAKRLEYLRGARDAEIVFSAAPDINKFLRARKGVLGDIIDSSPTWVGPPSAPLDALKDKLYPAASAPEERYTDFKNKYSGRQNLVYVGSNDGFMHAFKAGSFGADGKLDAKGKPNDGREAFAYMPAQVLQTIHSGTPALDFSGPQYAHNTFVNATPAAGDLFYKGEWRTWLVGGLGSGGNPTGIISDTKSTAKGALFALDITDPEQFSETNAKGLIVGDWTSDTLACTSADCKVHMGSVYGTPIIRRLHSGNWAVLFGNGLNSQSGTAGMFIMMVPHDKSGNITFRFLGTGSGADAQGNKNGIAYVSSSDLDLDHVTDYVYAGDVMGNLWRFDLTSNNPDNWKVSPEGPLFKTEPGQPISTKIAVGVGRVKEGQSDFRVMLGFGTGRVFPQTSKGAAKYATATQSLYGIWDWDMDAWNTLAPTSKYESIKNAAATITLAELQLQEVTKDVTESSKLASAKAYRSVSNNEVCWAGSSACGRTGKLGWRLTLPSISKLKPIGIPEQVIYNPTIAYNRLVVNTSIPGNERTFSCDDEEPSGYTMAVTLDEGRGTETSFFSSVDDVGVTPDIIVSGVGAGFRGTPIFFSANKNRPIMINQKSDGGLSQGRVNPEKEIGGVNTGNRVNWKKVR